MTAKIYYVTTNKSLRSVRDCLESSGINYKTQHLNTEPLTWEQLLEILMYTENGIEDILSTKSNIYVEMASKGVDFDDLTLTKLHDLIKEHPKLIKSPILVAKGNTLVGYNEGEMSFLKSRKERKFEYNQVLSILQMNDVNVPDSEIYSY